MNGEKRGPVSGRDVTDATAGHSGAGQTPQGIDETADARPRPADDRDAAEGLRQVDDYELLDEIARGAMGIVFRARQASLNRTVALKIMRSGQFATADEVARFRGEAEAAARLDHPLIVPVYDFGETGDQPWFSMGLVEGNSLAARIREKPLEAREAARLAKDIAEAVAYAHREGVIHRDIKPANILLTADDQVRITDFGLARHSEHASELTDSGQILGTPNYMAPEQALGASNTAGPTADVYAMGATLYCMLTGRPPFQAANMMDTLKQVIEKEPLSPRQLNSVIPNDLATICLKCLNKEPHRRYASAQALADDLERFLAGEPILARPIGSMERAIKWAKRKPMVAALTALSAVALLVLVAGGAWYQSRLAIALAEAETERDNASDASAKTTSVLYKSLTSDADFLNQVRPPGFGPRVWRLIDQARRLDTPEVNVKELRRLAVRSLGQLSFEEPLRFERLGSDVLAADVTPDNRFLFVGLRNNQVVVLDLDERREVHRFNEHKHPVAAIRMLADDHVLTASPFCREVYVWRCDDNGQWSSAGQLDLAQREDIFDFRLTPNGRQVVGWGPVRVDTVQASMNPWSEVVTRFRSQGPGANIRFTIRPVAAKPDDLATSLLNDVPASLLFDVCNSHLVVGYSWNHNGDNSVLVYDLIARRIERRIETDCGSLKGVVISRDGRHIAVAGHLGAAVFDRETGEQLAELDDIGRSTVKMFVGDEGDVFLNNERQHLLYSTRKRRIIDRFPRDTAQSTFRFSSAGRHWLRTEKEGIQVADLLPAGHREIVAHTKMVSDVHFSPDGRLIATQGEGDPVRLWDADSGRLIREVPGGVPAFHPSGRFLAVIGEDGVQLWSIPEGRLVAAAKGAFPFYICRFNARGDRLAGGGWSIGQFALWRLTGLEGAANGDAADVTIERVTTDPDGTAVFAWSPSGRRLARMRSDGDLYIEDMDQPAAGFRLQRSAQRLTYRTVVFLSEDRLGVATHPFQIWDLKSRAPLSTHAGPPWMNPVTRSPDGRFLVFKDRIVRSDPFEPLFTLPFSDRTIWCVDWSPDGRRLAYGLDGGALIIWDLANAHQRLASLELSWEQPGFRDLRPIESISQLLATKRPDANDGEWDARYREVAEQVAQNSDFDTLPQSVDWLTDNLPTTQRAFSRSADQRIRRLADLANALSKAKKHKLAERLLVRTIQIATPPEESDPEVLLQVSYVHHSLADLYNFQMTDRAEESVAEYEKENELIQKIMGADTSIAINVPVGRLFWMNHNCALAWAQTGDRASAIRYMDKALTLQQQNPKIGKGANWLVSSYRTMIQWLEAENRNDDAKSLRERARRSGVDVE